MARPSELTQDLVNDAADQLKAQGKKPSPNAVRDILCTGSFSRIKQMLNAWVGKQEQDEKREVALQATITGTGFSTAGKEVN
jgi:hypothetical protein